MAGTWGIFSSYGGDDPSKLVFVQRCQDSCLVRRDTSIISPSLGRAIQTPHGDAGDPGYLSSCYRDIGIPINFQQESGIVAFFSIELCVPLAESKGCEASCPDEAET